MEIKDPGERAKRVIEQAEKLDCKSFLNPKDIVEGSPNLNLAFVAQIFQHRLDFAPAFQLNYAAFWDTGRAICKLCILCRNGLSADNENLTLSQMMPDDIQDSREERAFRLWINSLGIVTYVNNLFEDVRNG